MEDLNKTALRLPGAVDRVITRWAQRMIRKRQGVGAQIADRRAKALPKLDEDVARFAHKEEIAEALRTLQSNPKSRVRMRVSGIPVEVPGRALYDALLRNPQALDSALMSSISKHVAKKDRRSVNSLLNRDKPTKTPVAPEVPSA